MSHLTTTSGAALVTKIFAAFLINLTSRSSNFNFTCSIKTTGYLKSLSLQYPFLGYPPVKIHNLFTNRINNPLHCGSAKIHFLVTATLSLSCRSPPVSKRKRFEWLVGSSAWNGPCLHLHQWCKDVLVLVSILDIVGITPAPPPKKKKWTSFTIIPWKKRTPFEEEMNQLKKTSIFSPQIAIAIGVLTSNRGEGDEPLWRIGRGTRVPLQGAVDVVPLLGAIVWLRGRVTTNFGERTWCHCWVPLQGAIVVCCGGGKGVVPLQGAIVVC